MGLLARVTRLFGGQGGGAVAADRGDDIYTRHDVQPHFSEQRSATAIAEPSVATEHETTEETDDLPVEEALTMDVETHDPEDPAATREHADAPKDISTEVKPFSSVTTRKNRQEMLDELSRNYQEVLQLVRKVSDHLDKEEEREQRVSELATKVDGITAALDAMPERINANASELNHKLVSAIDRQSQSQNEALGRVVEQTKKSGEAQGKLVSTMAEFRETMHDVSKSGERSNEILAEMGRNANETREEIAQLVITSKRWTTVAMVASLSIAVVAIVIAVIAIIAVSGSG